MEAVRHRHAIDPSLSEWMRSTRAISIRVTVTTFAFTALVGFLLVIVQQELTGSSSGSGRILGLTVNVTGITGTEPSLWLLAVALGAWVMLTSLSTLVVSRQVRTYLRETEPPRRGPTDMLDTDEDAGPGGAVMAERLLLQSYLNVLANGARTLAVTIVLVFSLPRVAVPGLLVGWVVLMMMGRHRFLVGGSHQQVMRSAMEKWREQSRSREAHVGLVDAIYLRESFQRRLTLPQAAIVVGVVLLGVVIPAWLAGGNAGGVSLVLVLMWLQGLIQVTTDMAPLGWRWRNRLDPLSRTGGPVNGRSGVTGGGSDPAPESPSHAGVAPDGSPIHLVMSPPPAWPVEPAVVWLRRTDTDRTLVAAAGPDGTLAGIPVDRLASATWQQGVSVVILPPASPSGGYPGLGTDALSARAALWSLVDPQDAVVLLGPRRRPPALTLADEPRLRRRVAVGGGRPAGAAWIAEPMDVQDADRFARTLHSWFDAELSDADVSEADPDAGARSDPAAEQPAPATG